MFLVVLEPARYLIPVVLLTSLLVEDLLVFRFGRSCHTRLAHLDIAISLSLR